MAKRILSPAAAPDDPNDRALLKRLKLSPEVAFYLHSRGIPFPTCPPLIKTPEAGEILRTARFDPERVDRVIKSFSLLRHTKGEWAGRSLRPDPWQIAYILAPVYGWVHKNDRGHWVRVVRECYVDVPRKNGKSTLCGGIAIYMTAADGEPGAEVVAAATTARQAGFVFNPIKSLAQKAPALKGYVTALAGKIIHPASGSYFEVISSAADAQHGANIHCGVIDELHVHKTADLVEVLETGTGSRRQPLIVKITTADDGKPNTIYARNRHRIEQLARRVIKHPATYGVVFAAEKTDDPFAESTLRKANPGFGISPTREYLLNEASKAQQSPADLAKYLRLHLGIRTKQETKYIDLAVWDRNASIVKPELLIGRKAYGGLDLATTSDICALCWVFPDPDDPGVLDAIWRLWVPEAALESLDRRTAGSASTWAKAGWLTVTPGNVADYDYIRAQVLADAETFDVQDLAYDRWNATQLVNDLVAEELPMRPLGQGYASMSAPTKELQRRLLAGTARKPKIRHGGNPAVRWQIDNFSVAMDASGNVKPDKGKATDKIDAGVALVMAIDGVAQPSEGDSVYETRGVVVVNI